MEVPEPVVRRVMRQIKDVLKPAQSADRDEELLAAIFGEPVAPQVEIVPWVDEARLSALGGEWMPPAWREKLSRPRYEYNLGTYRLSSARPYQPKVPVTVFLADRERAGVDVVGAVPGRRKDRIAFGHLKLVSGDPVDVSATRRKQMVAEALRELGATMKDVERAAQERDDIVEGEVEATCMYVFEVAYQIVLWVDFERPYARNKLLDQLESTLRHELAHAMDESIRQRHWRMVEEDNRQSCLADIAYLLGVRRHKEEHEFQPMTEGEDEWTPEQWATYYNLPTEVAARLVQTVHELANRWAIWDLQDSLRDSDEPASSILVAWARSNSPTVSRMWPHLDENNQRRVMRALYDMAIYDIAEVRKDTPMILPNRRRRRR